MAEAHAGTRTPVGGFLSACIPGPTRREVNRVHEQRYYFIAGGG
jgi:hypothetical protein